ncbi:MAG TPA: response regulator, partial [Myxococcaceae bacterium]|nr:response regulator [Myxococcaceae bacterium]
MLRVLVIDDEKNIRATLEVCLEGLGCKVATAGTPEAAVAAVEREPFDLAFLDLRLRDANGLDLLPRLLAARPELGVIIITA